MTYKEEAGICTLASQIERFTTERRYLKGVSPATENWYKFSLKAFMPVLSVPYQSTMDLKTAIAARIGALMNEGRGNKPVSINTYLRCLKAFLNWCHQEGFIEQPIKLSWLKEEEKILQTLSSEEIKRLICYSPRRTGKVNRFGGPTEARTYTIACLLLDTGLRISEALALTTDDADFDNLVLKVRGKGGKQRLVPFSLEMRKRLWRYRAKVDSQSPRLFCTRNGTQLSQRDMERDLKKLGRRVGITGVRMSPHTFRHTFAINYLRAGGNVFYLQRILGHSTLEMTSRYVRSLGIEDLQAVHDRLSPLSPLGQRG